VRIASAIILMVVGGAGLLTDARAVAQQSTQTLPYDPAYQAPVAQPNAEVVPPGYTDGRPGPGGAMPPGRTPASFAAGGAPAKVMPAHGGAEEELAIDSGLWEGAQIGPGCALCGRGANVPPADWYMEQEVRVLGRNGPENQGVAFHFSEQTSNVIGTEVLNTVDAAGGISGIWGMTIGHYFARDTQNRDHFVEFSFWGGNNWSDSAFASGGRLSVFNTAGQKTSDHGNLYSGFATTQVLNSLNNPVEVLNGVIMPGFDQADHQSIEYRSASSNFEINGRIVPRDREDRLVLHPNGKWRRECEPGRYISYLYGVRYFQLNETFNFHGESRTNIYDPESGSLIDTFQQVGDYGIVTHNVLLGAQVGADMTFRRCGWDWGFNGKIGPFVNFCDQESSITSVSSQSATPVYFRTLAWSKHSASLVAETGFHTRYQFRPNLIGHASYDFMFVTGLAMAPNQLQFNAHPDNVIDTGGFLFMHGVTFGLEWLY
jgi:hypothetical protein